MKIRQILDENDVSGRFGYVLRAGGFGHVAEQLQSAADEADALEVAYTEAAAELQARRKADAPTPQPQG